MIKEALDAHAKATARQFEDRANTVGASEIGQCARKTYFWKNEGDVLIGADRDADHAETWGAARRGQLFEDHFWVPALRRRFTDKLLYAGADQRTLVSGPLSATPDALLIEQPRDLLAYLGVTDIGGDSVVLECKTIDPRAQLEEAKPEHNYQVIVQMGLFHELTPHRPKWAVISYANASFLDDVVEFAVAFDPQIFATAKTRASEIMAAREFLELETGRLDRGRQGVRVLCLQHRLRPHAACRAERTAHRAA